MSAGYVSRLIEFGGDTHSTSHTRRAPAPGHPIQTDSGSWSALSPLAQSPVPPDQLDNATAEPIEVAPQARAQVPAGQAYADVMRRLGEVIGEERAEVLLALAGPSYKPMESVLEYLAGPRVVARSEVATDIGEDMD